MNPAGLRVKSNLITFPGIVPQDRDAIGLMSWGGVVSRGISLPVGSFLGQGT